MLKPFLFVFKELEGEKESHAVGSELLFLSPAEIPPRRSPSHTVGLEQGGDGVLPLFPRKVGVTIPRSGLGTRRKGGGI